MRPEIWPQFSSGANVSPRVGSTAAEGENQNNQIHLHHMLMSSSFHDDIINKWCIATGKRALGVFLQLPQSAQHRFSVSSPISA